MCRTQHEASQTQRCVSGIPFRAINQSSPLNFRSFLVKEISMMRPFECGNVFDGNQQSNFNYNKLRWVRASDGEMLRTIYVTSFAFHSPSIASCFFGGDLSVDHKSGNGQSVFVRFISIERFVDGEFGEASIENGSSDDKNIKLPLRNQPMTMTLQFDILSAESGHEASLFTDSPKSENFNHRIRMGLDRSTIRNSDYNARSLMEELMPERISIQKGNKSFIISYLAESIRTSTGHFFLLITLRVSLLSQTRRAAMRNECMPCNQSNWSSSENSFGFSTRRWFTIWN